MQMFRISFVRLWMLSCSDWKHSILELFFFRSVCNVCTCLLSSPPLTRPLDIEAPFCPFCCQSSFIVCGCLGHFVLALSESLHLGDTRPCWYWHQIGSALCVAVSKHLAWCDMMWAYWRLRGTAILQSRSPQSVGRGVGHCEPIIQMQALRGENTIL